MSIPGFYFCICPDSFVARAKAEELLSGFFPHPTGKPDTLERCVFRGEEGLDGHFWDKVTLQGFSSAPRAVLVRQAQTLPAEQWKKLSAALAHPRSGIVPMFFLESPWEKGNPKLPAHVAKLRCLEFASRQGWVWKHPGLDARSLPGYVQGQAKLKKLHIDARGLEILCAGLTPDGAAVDSTLEMLALAAPDGKITEREARFIATHSPELIIFDFIRHLQSGNNPAVWKTLVQEGDGGEALLFPLLSLLAREARLLWRTLAGEQCFPSFLAPAKSQLARKVGKTGLSKLFQAVMEAELAVKTGQRQPRQALEELVASLTLIFTSRPAA